MMDEGYIKFECIWEKGPSLSGIEDLITLRNEMQQLGLIGVYEKEGIGFGNISKRIDHNRFVISASATGHIQVATAQHFCLVTAVSISENKVYCVGPMPASSESMTHAMLYQCSENIQAVIHGHSAEIWEALLKSFPSTAKNVPYGTPEMAFEVQRLYQESALPTEKIFAMAGHQDGIATFGSKLSEAREKMLIILANHERK